MPVSQENARTAPSVEVEQTAFRAIPPRMDASLQTCPPLGVKRAGNHSDRGWSRLSADAQAHHAVHTACFDIIFTIVQYLITHQSRGFPALAFSSPGKDRSKSADQDSARRQDFLMSACAT
jgi:hypothetical protein